MSACCLGSAALTSVELLATLLGTGTGGRPTSRPGPRRKDRAVTRPLAEAGRLLDLPLYDHVIIAYDRYVSLATLVVL